MLAPASTTASVTTLMFEGGEKKRLNKISCKHSGFVDLFMHFKI